MCYLSSRSAPITICACSVLLVNKYLDLVFKEFPGRGS